MFFRKKKSNSVAISLHCIFMSFATLECENGVEKGNRELD